MLFEDRKLRIYARGACQVVDNLNWGGWHGKLPKEGYRVIRLPRRLLKTYVVHSIASRVGFRIGFKGNRGLEAKLRADLGMDEDDSNYDCQRVRELFEDQADEANERQQQQRDAAADSEPEPVKVGRSEKQKKTDEREHGKRRKDKAVQREQKARAQAQGMVE